MGNRIESRKSQIKKREKQLLVKYPKYKYWIYRKLWPTSDYYVELYQNLSNRDLQMLKMNLARSSRDSSNSTDIGKLFISVLLTIGVFFAGAVSKLGSDLAQAAIKLIVPISTSASMSIQKSEAQTNGKLLKSIGSLDIGESRLITYIVGALLIGILVYLIWIIVNHTAQNNAQLKIDSIDFILNEHTNDILE